MQDNATRSSIQVIDRMMTLLDALARHPAPVNLKQLAADTALHPSTAHRILNVMVGKRMVDRVEPGTYRLGLRLLELGARVRARIDVRDEALPFMRELHQALGETVHLSVRRNDEVICIERIAADRQPLRAAAAGAMPAPLHVTAAGKLFLAADRREHCDDYVKRVALAGHAECALPDPALLAREIEQARSHGYAVGSEPANAGASCIGAAIRGDDGRMIAGLCVSAPAERFNAAWAAPVKDMAARISRALGYEAAGADAPSGHGTHA